MSFANFCVVCYLNLNAFSQSQHKFQTVSLDCKNRVHVSSEYSHWGQILLIKFRTDFKLNNAPIGLWAVFTNKVQNCDQTERLAYWSMTRQCLSLSWCWPRGTQFSLIVVLNICWWIGRRMIHFDRISELHSENGPKERIHQRSSEQTSNWATHLSANIMTMCVFTMTSTNRRVGSVWS